MVDEALPIRRLTEAGMTEAELAKLENTWREYPNNRKQIAKFFAKLALEDIIEWLEVQRVVGHFRTIYDPVTDPMQVGLDEGIATTFIPLLQKGAPEGVAELTGESVIPAAQMPSSVVSSSATIDVCRQYGAEPGKDVTEALTQAMAALVTLGGGRLRFSKPGVYPIEGPMLKGTAFGYTYEGQILFPARTTGNGRLTIQIEGVTPAPKPQLGSGAEHGANLPGMVVLKSNATTGNVFDVIPGYEGPTGSGGPFSDLLLIFKNGVLQVPPNPQCGGIKAGAATRFRYLDWSVEPDPEFVGDAELPTGTAVGVEFPWIENAGSHEMRGSIYGYAVGLRISEHVSLPSCFLGECAVAIDLDGLGGHANFFGNVSIEECPVAIRALNSGHGGGYIYGSIDYENVDTNFLKPKLFVEDNGGYRVQGFLMVAGGHIGLAITGCENLDIANLKFGGAGYKNTYPLDNFERYGEIVSGNLGFTTPTSHPWLTVEGSFSIGEGEPEGDGYAQSLEASKASRAVIAYASRIGTGSRIVRGVLTLPATGSYHAGLIIGDVTEGSQKGHYLYASLVGGKVELASFPAGATLATSSAGIVVNGGTYELTVVVTHPPLTGSGPSRIAIFLGSTEVISYELPTEVRAYLTDEPNALLRRDGIQANGDVKTEFRRFQVLALAAPEKGAEGKQGPEGEKTPQVEALMPILARGAPVATTAAATLGIAFKAVFQRAIVYKAGKIRDISVWNGGTVNGSNRVAIFDTGEGSGGHYTLLWEGAEMAMAGANGYQSLGAPELSVAAGQQIMLVIMNNGTTATFGMTLALPNNASAELPAGYLPVTGGALPKLAGYHEYAELKYGNITEAQLIKGGGAPLIIGRIA